MAIVDAHQHVWNLSKAHYGWLGPDFAAINRTFEFDEVLPHLVSAGVQATVLVQSADNDDDTLTMLEVAKQNPRVAGVVAYVPLERPAEAAMRLAELRRDPLVVGVRNLTHDQPDPEWILRPDVDEGLGALERAGVPLDYVAVLPRHLENVPVISERHPRLRIVLDHLANPPIGLPDSEPWRGLLADAARNPLVFGKVSGLYSSAGDPGEWTPETVAPMVDHALELFGPDRLMYGGDWPVSTLAGGYDRIWAGLQTVFSSYGDEVRDAILGTTAETFYAIDRELLARSVAAADGSERGRP